MKQKTVTLIVLFFLMIVTQIFAESAEITASRDNTLYETASGNISNGEGIHFFAGRTNQGSNNLRRGLIYFPVHDFVSSGVKIDSVFLFLTLTKSRAGDQEISIHRVTSDWGEGNSNAGSVKDGDGAPADTNDATWFHSFYDTVQWQKSGGDYEALASASSIVKDATGPYTWGSTSQLVMDVQNWLDEPSGNFGWLVLGNESAAKTAKRFASRENTSDGAQPTLLVYYSQPNTINSVQTLPNTYSLDQNYPNPFNPETRIDFAIPSTGNGVNVSIEIFNILGQKIRTLISQKITQGNHSVIWDSTNDAGQVVPTGVYYYMMRTGEYIQTRKMFLIR